MGTRGFVVSPKMRVLLKDLGISPANVLRRANLPADLLSRGSVYLATREWFGLWSAIEAEADDELLPLAIGRAISFETFDPPIFAALCSTDLKTAYSRLSTYKRLCVPQQLILTESGKGLLMEVRWDEEEIEPPPQVALMELVFLVQLARLATRETIRPLRLTAPMLPQKAKEYADYFGGPIKKGKTVSVLISATDARLPLLTVDEDMWKFFEPELQRRLSSLDGTATLAERIRGILLELLPSGESSVEAVCNKLAMSKRTLQRRLKEKGKTYQALLDTTRRELATHYIRAEMTSTEISFLLGYESPNSFFRAFRSWTGQTPEGARSAMSNEPELSSARA